MRPMTRLLLCALALLFPSLAQAQGTLPFALNSNSPSLRQVRQCLRRALTLMARSELSRRCCLRAFPPPAGFRTALPPRLSATPPAAVDDGRQHVAEKQHSGKPRKVDAPLDRLRQRQQRNNRREHDADPAHVKPARFVCWAPSPFYSQARRLRLPLERR